MSHEEVAFIQFTQGDTINKYYILENGSVSKKEGNP